MKTLEEFLNDIPTETVSFTLKSNPNKKYSGLLSYERLDPDDIPEGWNRYSIRHADFDWDKPCTIEPQVWVNHFADVIIQEELVFPEGDAYFEFADINFEDE